MTTQLRVQTTPESVDEQAPSVAVTDSVPSAPSQRQPLAVVGRTDADTGEDPRPLWRQRMVDIERGFTLSFRGDSTFFAHFFVASVVLATAWVLQLSLLQWTLIVVAFGTVISAEMFRQVLKTLSDRLRDQLGDDGDAVLKIASAAVFVATLTSILVISFVFIDRLRILFQSS